MTFRLENELQLERNRTILSEKELEKSKTDNQLLLFENHRLKGEIKMNQNGFIIGSESLNSKNLTYEELIVKVANYEKE